MDDLQPDYSPFEPEAGLGTVGRIALGVFAVAAIYFLWTEHRAHTIHFLPWGIFALCLLMHFFMHRGHGGGGGPEA